jgi:hypothetical protein
MKTLVILVLLFSTGLLRADDVEKAKKSLEFLKQAETSLQEDLEELETDLKDLKSGTAAYDRKAEEIQLKKYQLASVRYAKERLEKEGKASEELKSLREVERYAGTSSTGVLSTHKSPGMSTSELDDKDPDAAGILSQLLEYSPLRYSGKMRSLTLYRSNLGGFRIGAKGNIEFDDLEVPLRPRPSTFENLLEERFNLERGTGLMLMDLGRLVEREQRFDLKRGTGLTQKDLGRLVEKFLRGELETQEVLDYIGKGLSESQRRRVLDLLDRLERLSELERRDDK